MGSDLLVSERGRELSGWTVNSARGKSVICVALILLPCQTNKRAKNPNEIYFEAKKASARGKRVICVALTMLPCQTNRRAKNPNELHFEAKKASSIEKRPRN